MVEETRTIEVKNAYGLHARPAAELVKVASRFVCDVFVEKDGLEVNGKSIMGVLMLAAESGSVLKLRTVGADAAEAMEAIVRLAESEFKEGAVEEEDTGDLGTRA